MKPKISAALKAQVALNAPSRLVKKLDKDPTRARDWTWSDKGEHHTIQTDTEACVRLAKQQTLKDLDDISCSCLLSPKCLHILSVVAVLPLDDNDASLEEVDEQEGRNEVADKIESEIQLNDVQREVAQECFALLSRGLSRGFQNAGVSEQGSILRSAHIAKINKLHTLSSSLIGVAHSLNALQADSPTFSLGGLRERLLLAIECSYRLNTNVEVKQRELGVARRGYHHLRAQRLEGFFSEPLVGASGHAGVVTFLVSNEGRLFSLSDVRPATETRAEQVYRQGVHIGDLSLSHQALARASLFLNEGKASKSGRLGQGQGVKAVSAGGREWSDAPIAHLFEQDLKVQLAALAQMQRRADDARPVGWDLLFLKGAFVDGGSSFQLDNGAIIKLMVRENESLRFRENLRILGKSGCPYRLVARFIFSKEVRVLPLAASALNAKSDLSSALGKRVCLGLDKLVGANIEGDHTSPQSVTSFHDERTALKPDALDTLERVVDRVTLGGRRHLPQSMAKEIAQTRGRLRKQMLQNAEYLLDELYAQARTPPSTGGRESDDESFALAYVKTAAYLQEVQRLSLFRTWERATT